MLKMKRPSRLVMALALCLLLCTSNGIRLPRESSPSTTDQEMNDVVKSSMKNPNEVKAVKLGSDDDKHCSPSSSSSSTTSFSTRQRGGFGRIAKGQQKHHWFPWIHEDYRGPKRHIAKHHALIH